MADIMFLDPINNARFEMDFAELMTVIKGSSIKSAALGDDFFELGLTDAFNLRIQGRPTITLMSTLNKGQTPPVRLKIVANGETPTAREIEERIRSLRQLYATTFLINMGRSAEAVRMLDSNPQADLEELLGNQDRLFVVAASEGTFWLTVLTKTRTAFRNLGTIVPLFYDEGRQALLERMRANTELKKLAVKEKEMLLGFERANKFVDLVQKIEKIKDPHVKERIRRALASNAAGLGTQLPALPSPTSAPKPKLTASTRAKKSRKR